MASEKAKKAAAARLKGLDKEANKVKRNKLRAQVAMGDRKTRKKAASKLSSMPRQWKD
jgi:hypothetical protein